MANTYKGILNSEIQASTLRQSQQDQQLLKIEEALKCYKHRYTTTGTQNKGIAHDALYNIHDELKSYWIQFGFLTLSTRKNFLEWACNNIIFKEYKQGIQTNPLDDSEYKCV